MKKFLFVIFVGIIGFFVVWSYIGAPGGSNKEEVFIVPRRTPDFDVASSLLKNGLIKNEGAFRFLMNSYAKIEKVPAGGYRLRKTFNAFQILQKLKQEPELRWVTVGGCNRKEEVGEILADILDWKPGELEKWNNAFSDIKSEYFEGVYYPDTYLIPIDESGDKVAKRFINRFNEVFAPYADKYLKANIRWVTGLKIASLIAREAAGKEDMHLVSGIIWNRLNIKMPLQIDATMQYTTGKKPDGSWWGYANISEKEKDTPYNSYLYRGLPPTPICSPPIEYIEAALNPEETPCLFYLHDSHRQIHCSETYEEHLEAIDKYL